jgi:hypothetical protein
MVVDPEMANRPLAVDEWRRLQDSDDLTCILLADWNGDLTINRENSSPRVLQTLVDRDPNLRSFNGNEEKLISSLTHGSIAAGKLINPFNPPKILDKNGVPSIEATFAHFGKWLAPLAEFRKWRSAKAEEIMSTRAAASGLSSKKTETADMQGVQPHPVRKPPALHEPIQGA